MRSGIVTLTTDFGLDDPFVGILHGVLLARFPEVRVVNLTHGLDPGDVRGAALALAAAFPFFPPGTVHVAVVDPGVGTGRRIAAAEARGQIFLAPDSGLLPAVLDPFAEGPLEGAWRSVEAADLFLTPVSTTFHGRDVFAPVAAALARGRPLPALGPPLPEPVRLAFPRPVRARGALDGEVIHVDRFGNLVTNFRAADLPPGPFRIRLGGKDVEGPAAAYGAVPPGGFTALWGSAGYLEIARRDGHAARALNAGRGHPVRLVPRTEDP